MSEFCLVTQRIGAFVADSPADDDRKPDHKSVSGSVTFTPKLKDGDAVLVTDEDGVKTISVVPTVGQIVDGVLSHEGEPGVYLFAGGENSNPSTIVYTVTYSGLTVGKQSVKLRGTSLEAIPGEEIDLSGLIPVAGSTGQGVARGEKGKDAPHLIVTGEAFDAEGNTVISFSDGADVTVSKGDKGDPGPTGALDLTDESIKAAIDRDVIPAIEGARDEALGQVEGVSGEVLQAAEEAILARTQAMGARDHVTTVAGQIDAAFTDSIPPYLQRTGLDDAYMRGSELPLPGALGVLRARLMAKDVAPIVLVFAGSSTTSGSNVTLANRWVTKIAERASHEPVVSSYEDAVAAAPFYEGLTVVNMGRSGFNSATYIRSEEAPIIGSWAPTLVMHAAGANDAATSWGTPAVVARNIASRIDAINTASPLPVAHIVMHQHERIDQELLAPWREYWPALAEIAATRPNVTALNADDIFKALGSTGSDPLGLMSSDKIHVNTKGHAVYGDLIGDVLNLPEKVDRTTILFDDFNRPDNEDVGGDSPTTGPSGAVWESSSTSAKFHIQDNRLVAGWGTSVTSLIDTGAADYDLTVDLDFLEPGTSIAGVVFRAADISNRWGVYIGGVNNNVHLYRMIDGANAILTPASVDGAKYSKTGLATMRIRVKGRRISAWIDGTHVIEYTMSEAENAASRTWTKIGPRVTASVAEFDNLKVTSV